MKNIAVFLIGLSFITPAHAQNKIIDSLKKVLAKQVIDTQQINTFILIAEAYRKDRNDSAIIFYQDAMKRAIEKKYTDGELKARNRYADFLTRYKNDDYKALGLFLANVKLEEATHDTALLMWDLRNIAFIYDRIDDIPKQLEYTMKMRDASLAKQTKNKVWQAFLQANVDRRLGDIYQKLNETDSAKKYFFRTFRYGVDYYDPIFTSLGGTALGSLYKENRMADSAFFYYRYCIPTSIKAKRNDLYQLSLLGISGLFLKAGNIDSTYRYALQAYALTDNLDVEAPALLSEIYHIKNQPDSAYKYLKISIERKDSTLNFKKLAQIQNLTMNASLEKQELEQANKEAVMQYKTSIKIYSLMVGLTILISVIAVLYRNNRRRLEANKKLATAYTNLKSTQTQLIQSEKMASLGELTAGIAHEIQNPLNFVNNFSDVNAELIDELVEEADKGNTEEVKAIAKDIKENEQKINHHGKRADAIIKSMLQHSRSSSGVKEPTDINALCDEYLRLSYHGLRAKDKSFNATIKTDFDESIGNINIIPQDIGRVLLNLINNAFYAASLPSEGGFPDPDHNKTPTVWVISKKNGNKVLISVKDNGPGIPPKILDKIFQPFFTTKPTGQGTGLGLSLAYDIVKAHGGNLNVETTEGVGTNFIINLPV